MSIHNSKRKHSVIALVMCLFVLALSGCSRGNENDNQVTAVDRVSSRTSTSISSEHKLPDSNSDLTANFSFTDGTTANLTWFYVDGGFVYNEEFSVLPGDASAGNAE